MIRAGFWRKLVFVSLLTWSYSLVEASISGQGDPRTKSFRKRSFLVIIWLTTDILMTLHMQEQFSFDFLPLLSFDDFGVNLDEFAGACSCWPEPETSPSPPLRRTSRMRVSWRSGICFLSWSWGSWGTFDALETAAYQILTPQILDLGPVDLDLVFIMKMPEMKGWTSQVS